MVAGLVFIEIMFGLMALLLVAAVAAVVVSKVISLRKNRTPRCVNGVPAKAITWSVAAGTLVLVVISYLASSADSMLVNGEVYDDASWLRTASMCVTSSLVLLLVASACILFGLIHSTRRKKRL